MQKKILVPNGSYTDIRLIKAFKQMGFYVITSGNNPELTGHKYADEYVEHDYTDYKGMLEVAKQCNIDNISACANDFGTVTAAYIAENMGLPGHDTFDNARICSEKDRFKEFAQKNDLMVIPSTKFDDVETAKEFVKNKEYPLIVKPTDLSGGKGITRVDTVEEAEKAIDVAFEKSKVKHIVIEPFIEGDQYGFTSFLVNRKVVAYTSFNEYMAKDNRFLVGYASLPAKNIDQIAPYLIDQIEKMADILCLVDGIFHLEYKVRDGKPMIIETMRRCLGNYSLKAASEAIDFDWEKWIAKSYLGEDCSKARQGREKDRQILEYYIQAPRDGVVEDIVIDDSVKACTYDEIMQWAPGMEVTNHRTQMLGFIFMEFPTEEKRDEMADIIADLVTVKMAE